MIDAASVVDDSLAGRALTGEVKGPQIPEATDDTAHAKGRSAGRRVSAHSGGEDHVTRQRRQQLAPSENRFQIILEAAMGDEEKHHFFRYEADGDEDLPGIFLATSNLLQEGREVRVRIRLGDSVEPIETDGVVSWHQAEGSLNAPVGMGVEIVTLAEEAQASVARWLGEHPAILV